jgi:histidine ammonia-lyase
VRDAVRAAGVAGPGPDRHLAPEIEAVVQAVRSGALLDAAQQVLPAPLR